MPVIPKELEAKPGRLIQQTWELWEDWERAQRLYAGGPNVRLNQLPLGTFITATIGQGWPHPYQVGVSGRRAVVREGVVNFGGGDVHEPRVQNSTGVWVTLSGEEPTSGDRLGIPQIEIEEPPAAADPRSYICLALTADENGVPDFAAPNADRAEDRADWPLTIVHRTAQDLKKPRTKNQEPGTREAHYEPLAVLYWDAGLTVVKRFGQIVHHNLRHSWLPPRTLEGDGEHWFSAL